MTIVIPFSVEAIIQRHNKSSSPLDVMSISSELTQERAALKSRSASTEEDFGTWCELAVFSLSPGFDRTDDPWASFFRPVSSISYEDGTTIFCPDVRDANVDALEHWRNRANALTHPVLKARYADVVWDLGRIISKDWKQDVTMGKAAVDAYLDILRLGLADGIHTRFTYAQRAVDLAAQIRDLDRIGDARAAFLKLHHASKNLPHGMWWVKAYDHLVEHKTAKATAEEMSGLVADLEAALSRSGDTSNPTTFDPHVTQGTGERLVKHYTRLGDRDSAQRVQTTIAKAFEHVASLGDSMLASSFLQDSLDAYKKAGLNDDAERVRLSMEQKIRDARREMKTVSSSIDIPAEKIDEFISQVVVESSAQTLANLAITFLPRIEELEEMVQELTEHAPLLSMITHHLYENEHIAGKVGSVEDDPFGRLLLQADQVISLGTPWLGWAMGAALKKHDLTPDHFVAWSNRRGLFGDSRTDFLKQGLEAWFDKDYVKALHVIIPQIEHAIRSMVSMVGKPSTKAHKTVKRVSVAISMGDIVYDDEIISALGPIGKRLKVHLLALYADPRGRNLRNKFAHGLLTGDDIREGIVLWLVHTLLVLGLWEPPTN